MAKHDDIPKTDPSEIEALIQRLKQSNIEPRDTQLVERLLRLVLSMASLLQQKNASIKRLKRLIFGPSSDKRAATGNSTEEEAAAPSEDSEQQPGSDSSPGTTRSSSSDRKPKRPGHGRMAASAYTGARVVICRHPDFKAGDHCPDPLCRGHLYAISSPAIFIQLTGQPLVGATRYEQEVVRCSACLERFTAPMPASVTPEKYDATCDVSLAIAKYGASLPWYRLARMQESFGVPMPESVQFERCEVHHKRLRLDTVPISYGLVVLDFDVVNKYYPNSNRVVYDGCVDDCYKKAEVLYCQSCRAAESRRKSANLW